MEKFKVGDIVRGAEGSPYAITGEDTLKAVVVSIDTKYGTIRIRILKHRRGHYIGSLYSVNPKFFELINEKEVVVIRRKDSETIAEHKKGKKVVNSASARCNPTDEFDFEEGARLALNRLFPADKAVQNTGSGSVESSIFINGQSVTDIICDNIMARKIINVKKDIEVFDKVRVTNAGLRYSAYCEWFNIHLPNHYDVFKKEY